MIQLLCALRGARHRGSCCVLSYKPIQYHWLYSIPRAFFTPRLINSITGSLYLPLSFTHSAHPPTSPQANHEVVSSVFVGLILLFCVFVYSLKIFFNVYAFNFEREVWGEAERGKDREYQAASCQHRPWHGGWTHKMWDCDLSQNQEQVLNQLSHPRAPSLFILNANSYIISYFMLKGNLRESWRCRY